MAAAEAAEAEAAAKAATAADVWEPALRVELGEHTLCHPRHALTFRSSLKS